MVEDLGTYLGISAVWGKTKTATLSYVKECVLERSKDGSISSCPKPAEKFLLRQSPKRFLLIHVFRLLDRLCKDIDTAVD